MDSKEIAKLAGVSRSTVSKVINNYPDISEETKKKVNDIIEKNLYVPNTISRQLKGIPSRILGLFVADIYNNKQDTFTISRSNILTEYIAYAVDIAQNLNYNLLITVIRDNNYRDFQRIMLDKSIAGGIVLGDTLDQNIIDNIAERGGKLSLHNQRPHSDFPNIVNVNVDNFKFGYIATSELIKNGHKGIAIVSGYPNKYSSDERLHGYCRAMFDHGLPINQNYVGTGDFHRSEGGYEATKKILTNSHGNMPTAIVVSNSVMLSGVYEALYEIGMKVPEDISLISIGKDELSNRLYQHTVAVDFDYRLIATITVSKITELIEIGKLENNNFIISKCNIDHAHTISNIRT